jgi:hypothetical protein
MRYNHAVHTAWRTVAGQAFIVNTRDSTLHELNDIGTAIWEYLKEPATIDEIARRLEEDFDVSRREACDDASAFIERLAAAGLVTADNAS